MTTVVPPMLCVKQGRPFFSLEGSFLIVSNPLPSTLSSLQVYAVVGVRTG